MKNFIRYFIQGLIILVPVSITIFVLYQLFAWISGLFSRLDVMVHPYADPFLVLLAIVLIIFLAGVIGSNLVARFFIEESGKFLEKIPFVRLIYSPIKDFTSAFIGNKRVFQRPVFVVTNKETGTREIGFITDDDLSELGLSNEFVAVYIPMSYAISGRLLIVPRQNISPLDVPASEAMKFIVSGGVSEVD
ncbi:MAG TPA: DUF502 domain-containing protein [Bacteroidia bacterium]|nr:DUF502 domain-containing protein [Bacteroidia bacterium]